MNVIIIIHLQFLIIKLMTKLQQNTLFHLVDCIKLKKFKLSRSSTPETDQDQHSLSKYWSDDEKHLFFIIVLRYGADYSILKHYFPTKSRNQIKKKCIEIEKKRKGSLERAQEKKSKEERKDFFDKQVMQLDMIKWHNSKPNKPENGIDSE